MDKEKLITHLQQLTDYLKKDSVKGNDCKINISQGTVEGVDPENYQFSTYHANGKKDYTIEISLYDSEADESDEAYDPMQNMKKS